jgi:hypothetical protein
MEPRWVLTPLPDATSVLADAACLKPSRLEARRVVFSRVLLGVRCFVALLPSAACAPRCLREGAAGLLLVDVAPVSAERFLAARFFVVVLIRVAMPDE